MTISIEYLKQHIRDFCQRDIYACNKHDDWAAMNALQRIFNALEVLTHNLETKQEAQAVFMEHFSLVDYDEPSNRPFHERSLSYWIPYLYAQCSVYCQCCPENEQRLEMASSLVAFWSSFVTLIQRNFSSPKQLDILFQCFMNYQVEKGYMEPKIQLTALARALYPAIMQAFSDCLSFTTPVENTGAKKYSALVYFSFSKMPQSWKSDMLNAIKTFTEFVSPGEKDEMYRWIFMANNPIANFLEERRITTLKEWTAFFEPEKVISKVSNPSYECYAHMNG